MQLRFEERPYSGRNYRPRPEILLDETSRLLIVATPWGPRAAARKVIARMTDYLALAREDSEATSPFERLSCLSDEGNKLRIAALLANEVLYREENSQEYNCGVELFAAVIESNELVWLQAGNPQILLARRGRALLPIGSQIDLSFDISTNEQMLPPLPAQLLGLDPSLNMNINSFRLREADQLVLLSHSHLPDVLFGPSSVAGQAAVSIDELSRRLAKSGPETAFWLGILSVDFEPLDQDSSASGSASDSASGSGMNAPDMSSEELV